ncbi:hypothetical protein BZA70DRAFT_278204 [Myxozyma melibiosi]|uniref:Protein transport protein SEC31 n=1 Tax=Myxozyma melibiosi TaxID=54550 RepID=A0ABR1F6J6_9ASCO
MEIPRTATFAWSPGSQLPIIATGTVAGAVDADFSSTSTLELWDLNIVGKPSSGLQLSKPLASVTSDVKFHDLVWGSVSAARPRGIIAAAMENGDLNLWEPDALLKGSTTPLLNSKKHSGAIKSLDFNPSQSNLLASAGSKGEIFIWDLDKQGAPITPGKASSRLDEIECVSWNTSVAHILATAGNTGFTSVWDLKNRREVLHLFYPGPGGGGRRGVSSVVWHPENSTKLITACGDDSSPVILLWDLRNANAPEKVLSGHNQGVLSLSWSKRDPDLLLSSGKDNRTLLWNPQSGEMLGEFPIATNWTFETRWYERNPSVFASASFDGKISVQSLQNTKTPDSQDAAPKPEGNDFWNTASYADTPKSTFSLKQPPKWLKRPISATFGFGGKLVTLKQDEHKKSVLTIKKVVIEPGMASETEKFEEAIKSQSLKSIAEARAEKAVAEQDQHDWKVLLMLYEENPKKKLIELLGYTPSDLEELFKKFSGLSVNGEKSVKEDEAKPEEKQEEAADQIFGASAGESDFFSNIGNAPASATNGDIAEYVPTGAFSIFNSETPETDKLITQALVLGDFSSAIDICLKDDRMSDAFMLALLGDDACRAKVQKAYFQKSADGPSYIRVMSSISSKNLLDLVDNADIDSWKEIVVALCTFAPEGDFNTLVGKLGDRLGEARKTADASQALELRKSASICYFVGADLPKLVAIWIEELADMEKEALKSTSESESPFAVHIKSLQDFIEKVTVFRNAVKYNDAGAKLDSDKWALSELYEAYREYANVVASQGFLELAHKYLVLLPTQYPLADLEQERVLKASSKTASAAPAATGYQPYGAKPATSSYTPYAPTASATAPGAVPAPAASTYTPVSGYQPLTSTYQPPAPPAVSSQPPAPSSGSQYGHAYHPSVNIPAPPAPVVSPPDLHHEHAPIAPPPVTSYQSNTKGISGWNDALPLKSSSTSRKQTPAPAAPITAPFPGMQAEPASTFSPPPQTPGSVPSYGRPANIAPPPINAKPPQSLVTSPVQSPPPTARAVNPYAPTVEFVSVGQTAPSLGPPTAPPVGASAPLPPPPVSKYAAPPTSVPQPGPPPAASPYAPPTQPSQPASAPPQRNPYAPTAPAPATAPPAAAPPVTSAPPPMSHPPVNFSQYEPSPLQQDGYAQSVGRSASPAMSVVAESMHPHHHSAPPQKYPAGDRSHIPAEAMVIVDALSAEMARVKQRTPQSVARQVQDTEKRLNVLFDHLNNGDLLSPEAVREMIVLASALHEHDFETAYSVQINLSTTRMEECGQWMVGVRRLIDMSKRTWVP